MSGPARLSGGVFIAALVAAAGSLLVSAAAHGATITVTSTADNDPGNGCDIREALTAANANNPFDDCGDGDPGLDTIDFNITGGGQEKITLTGGELTVIDRVTIDGTSQGGFSGTPLIEIEGDVGGGNVLTFKAGSASSTVQGLALTGATNNGIELEAASGSNTIIGNYLGLDPDGSTDAGNGAAGIEVNSSSNVIGGVTAAARNVISGNGGSPGTSEDGIFLLAGDANEIKGNYIGTDAAGTVAVANDDAGLELQDSASTEIGTGSAAGRNVISGNTGHGVFVRLEETDSTQVLGNYIGVGADGTTDVGNGAEGVFVQNGDSTAIGAPGAGNVIANNRSGVAVSATNSGGGFFSTDTLVQGNSIGVDATGAPATNIDSGVLIRFGARGNTIGGTATGAGNLIAHNTDDGVSIDGSTPETDGNAILGNSIHSNGTTPDDIGIDLGIFDGVTDNDIGDVDAGANEEQNFPITTGAQTNSADTTVQGTLDSAANRTYRIEYFANSACDASGNGQGETFLGAQNVATNGSGDTTISATVAASTVGEQITATATDQTPDEANSSEFSACVAIASKPEPPPGAGPSDTTAPNADVFAKKKQKAKKPIKVKVGSDEAATVLGTGKVTAKGGSNRALPPQVAKNSKFKLKKQSKDVAADGKVTLKLKVKGKKNAKKLVKLVKKGAKATAKITVTLTDAAGNASSKKVTVKLK